MDRDTKLIAILRRQYHIILTALGENIFRIGFATPPNTEYIFSQLAVNIMWYCRLKIAICLYNWHDILCLTATEVSMIELFSITRIIEERKITYRCIRVQVGLSRFGHRF